MKCPAWLLKIILSYLKDRFLILTLNGFSSSPKPMPGGSPAGTLLGGLIFILKFNGALLRPKIQRPFENDVEQWGLLFCSARGVFCRP